MAQLILTAGASPHIKHPDTSASLMRDVLIALAPASLLAVYNYGWRAAVLIVCSIAAAVASEYLWNHFMKKPQTVGDLSAAVTGLLLALNVTSLLPWWMVVVGSAFAILVVKMLFGGIGCNFVNPALAARALLMASWPVQMTAYLLPGTDVISGATPLNLYKQAAASGLLPEQLPSNLNLFVNSLGGCMGEASKLALLLGALYLLIRRVIQWKIPVIYTLVTALLGTAFAAEGFMRGDFFFQLLSGGLILGAFFMASDYTTSPMSKAGQVIFALGCAFLSFIIRRFGGYPEGVSYSILIMNLFVPLIDRFTAPKTFGGEKLHEKSA